MPMTGLAPLQRAQRAVEDADLHRRDGRVSDLIGLIVEARGLHAEVGELCWLDAGRRRPAVPAEVVGFREGRTLLMPLGELHGIGPATRVTAAGEPLSFPVGDALLGRVIDALGRPLDGKGPLTTGRRRSTAGHPPDALSRPRIHDRLSLGVRALDALVPCGRGQRLGIFAGSGVGKSSLLGMISRAATSEVNVIGLIGERGREVREFVERDLGDALERSVVVVATSDQPALLRLKAAQTATAAAEHFRDRGADVLLMMDSVTRAAMAQREIGLAIGEPPTTRGYTPSVFALLPQLLERSGTSPNGSITGLYTVLVDGDDMNEPVADAVRSILDGHIVLTRQLAHRNHYPAVDVLQSASRLATEICARDQRDAAGRVRSMLATLRDNEDLVTIGAYQAGSNPELDVALAARPALDAFLRQSVDDPSTLEEADESLAIVSGVPPLGTVPDASIDQDAGSSTDAAVPVAAGPTGPEPAAIPPFRLPA